jgi:hypothetical protein
MARGRLLSTEASVDPELNSLSSASMLLYLLTLPHLDRDGLTDGTPMRLTAIAAPLRTELRDGAGALINEWVEAGLVVRYGAGKGRNVLFFKGFRKHQQGLEYGREPVSKFPPPPGWTRTREGLVPDDPELCFRLAEGMHAKSGYRAALLHAAGADVPNRDPEPDDAPTVAAALIAELSTDLAETSRIDREGSRSTREQFAPNQREEKLTVSDDDDASIPPTPIMAIGGVQGGADGTAAAFSEDELRLAAYQLGSLLDLHVTWNAFDVYIAKRSQPTLNMLLEWEWYYLDMPPKVQEAVLAKIESLTAVIRSNMNQGAKAPITTPQRRRLHQRIGEVLVICSEEAA